MAEIRITVEGVPPEGIRLDRHCASQPGAISRSRLKGGALEIRVNGKPARLSRLVRDGDQISISWEDPEPASIEPEEIPLRIIYEDERVTVVDKSQGMVTHPAAGNWSGTLVNALLWHWGRAPIASGAVDDQARLRPGIVHRLDKDTSGVIIAARTREAEEWLQGEFQSRRARKVYAAILTRVPPSVRGEIRTRIYRDPANRKRFKAGDDERKGKAAHTSYKVVHAWGRYALVLFLLHTGRTHQLRVHSKHIGCPILGDPVYGKKDPLFPDASLMLHARSLEIRLPGDEQRTRFVSRTPPRFRDVIARLEETNGK